MTFPEAARLLGITKQHVHNLVFAHGEFATVRAVGEQPLYLLLSDEVLAKKTDRESRQRTADIPA